MNFCKRPNLGPYSLVQMPLFGCWGIATDQNGKGKNPWLTKQSAVAPGARSLRDSTRPLAPFNLTSFPGDARRRLGSSCDNDARERGTPGEVEGDVGRHRHLRPAHTRTEHQHTALICASGHA
eukprot:1310381-Rhodomonas_salina.7